MSSSGGDSGSDGGDGAARPPDGAAVDPYDELGIDPRSDASKIRQAYHAKARLLHPDVGGDPAAMARLNAAYELIRDPARRRVFDASRPRPARVRRDAPPHWTGAAGPPPGKPAGPVLDFGIFAGWSLGEIARHDPGYLDWLAKRPEGRPHLAAIERFRAGAGRGSPEAASSGPADPRARWRR